jgi:SAM-dependent methyltransferase
MTASTGIALMIDSIYQRGTHYDRLFDPGVAPFWLEEGRRHGGPILELGCGTGRIAIPLAQAGFAVTGVDRAPSMLAEARRKAAEAGVVLAWHPADMREFELEGRFALAFIANNTLCHLRRSDLRQANLGSAQDANARMEGAVCDRDTCWPSGFNPLGEGCTLQAVPTEVVPAATPVGRGDEVAPPSQPVE